MATGTGIYTPPEMLGDNVADSTKFLRGDNKWVDPAVEFSPNDFVELLTYAFQRIEFLEQLLRVKYGDRDIVVPDSYELVQEKLEWK